jgi:very-short-patch-repair endonuclease
MAVTQSQLDTIRNGIANSLARISASKLPLVCCNLGLAEGEESEAFQSKAKYVRQRIDKHSEDDLIALASQVVELHPNDFHLLELLRKARSGWSLRVTELTRRDIVSEIIKRGSFSGDLGLIKFLERLWPLDMLRSTDIRFDTLFTDFLQHTSRNDDYTDDDLLDRVEILKCSDEQFALFLEMLVDPLVRRGEKQKEYVQFLNEYLRRDSFELVAISETSGYPVYGFQPITSGVAGCPKNLIFASTGPKPEIIIRDAINNSIEIVRHAEHVLIYDNPIVADGLTWFSLVDWWEKTAASNDASSDRALYMRLKQSLASSIPEQHFFRAYYSNFKPLGASLPALIPQVYLHYDPLTARELGGLQRLLRQRMDFLMLLPHRVRIVFEVDGKQHYSERDVASPARYAEMVREDRDLRLRGYEIFRFGAIELTDKETAERTVEKFFRELFNRHNVS